MITELVTMSSSTLDLIVETEILSDLSFDQDGFIEAATPALALEITPTLRE